MVDAFVFANPEISEKLLTPALLGIAQSSDNPVDKDMESYL